MTEAMLFLQKTILLSYDPRPFWRGDFFLAAPGESKFIPGRGNPRWSTKNLSSQKDGLSTAPVIKLNKQSKKSNTGK